MEKIEIVKLLQMKKKFEEISSSINKILNYLDLLEQIELESDIQVVDSNFAIINFMLDELILKIKKDI